MSWKPSRRDFIASLIAAAGVATFDPNRVFFFPTEIKLYTPADLRALTEQPKNYMTFDEFVAVWKESQEIIRERARATLHVRSTLGMSPGLQQPWSESHIPRQMSTDWSKW